MLFAALALGISMPSHAQDLSGRWRLEILNAKREVVTTFTVRFTRDQAQSCLALVNPKTREDLKWRKLKIEAMSTTESTFYPVTDPLAYGIEEGTLTIGNVEFCDGYALLEGGLAVQPVHGRYFTLGVAGSVDRGSFKLSKVE
ncbi:hypothetical protein [Pelomonas sp. SE-A7]|uniref:hypothetical protein n=1 Tax=Pelomonas sp. SE-A7 TaxID=3054953 RepID=UPI00259CE89D|nr:hypothetical protein [Pelomonas sp. SE-A7]MDM4767183.1 hypothetical protein [Pelomonas sp. SE-A7]